MKTLFYICAALALFASVASHLTWKDGLHSQYTFEHYQIEFGKVYKTEQEHKMRELIFNQKLKRIHEINSNPKYTWKAASII